MSDQFLGEIRMVGFSFAPVDWALCNGQLLSISQNSALYALLGTLYGGDGQQTFGLPDMRSRIPLGFGQGPGLSNYVQGEKSGNESVTLTNAQIGGHTHAASASIAIPASTTAGSTATPGTTLVLGQTADSSGASTPVGYVAGPSNTTLQPFTNPVTVSPNAGGSVPFSILNPSLAINFIVALSGIYPSRG